MSIANTGLSKYERSVNIFLRFKDLKERGIIQNWPTLLRWIKDEGFPAGRYLAPNTRVWSEAEVEAWLAARPTVKPKRVA
jgi:predicted DNA-binding transcriptional regulator AlpA